MTTFAVLDEDGSPGTPSPEGLEPSSSSAPTEGATPTGADRRARIIRAGTEGTDTSRSTASTSLRKAQEGLLSSTGGARPALNTNNNGPSGAHLDVARAGRDEGGHHA